MSRLKLLVTRGLTASRFQAMRSSPSMADQSDDRTEVVDGVRPEDGRNWSAPEGRGGEAGVRLISRGWPRKLAVDLRTPELGG
jgi:hypothetical protein